eukprot:g2174.t1
MSKAANEASKEEKALEAALNPLQARWPTTQMKERQAKASKEIDNALAEMRMSINDARRHRSGEERRALNELRKAELDALRREVLQLQGPHPSKPSSDAQASELQLQWVRLFEKELERLRRLSESYEDLWVVSTWPAKEPFSVLEHRLSRLESVALPESGRDLDELAELVLSELHDLQQKVRQLGTSSQQRQAGVALHAGHMRASTQPLKLTEGPRNADESPSRSPVGAAVARNEMFQRLEESNASRGPWSLIFWRQAGMHL